MKSTTTNLHRTIRAALLAAVAGTALVAAPSALAQSGHESHTVISTSNDENTARVEVRNGKYTISVNGKEVKSGSTSDAWTTFDLVDEAGDSIGTITRENGEFIISLNDENGDPVTSAGGAGARSGQATIYRHALLAEREAARAGRAANARAFTTTIAPPAPGTPGTPGAPGEWGTPPKSMLGVTLESPGEALSAHLGINRETSTILTSVSDDLPAAKSGLKLYDVIIEVNGEPAAPDTLRKFLREKTAGDILALKVARGAERKDISVTLEAYDPARLNIGAAAWAPGVSTTGNFTINAFDDQMEAKAREMESLGKLMAEKSIAMRGTGKDAKALEDLGRQMEQLAVEMEKRAQEMAQASPGTWDIFRGGQGGGGRTIIGRRQGAGGNIDLMLPPTPRPPGYLNPMNPSAPPNPSGFPAPTPDTAALKERMDQMDERLAKLTEILEKAVEKYGANADGTPVKKGN